MKKLREFREMAIKVIVFDFDGTLVESNSLKYHAFFDLFPQDEFHSTIIREVLADHLEETRYVILSEILKRTGDNEKAIQEKAALLAERYNAIVIEGAKHCAECPGSEDLLRTLAPHYILYVSSTTPEHALKKILAFRRWDSYFTGIFGYPRKKMETLRGIIAQERVEPTEVLVVGDGESDRVSAQKNECLFFDVRTQPLSALRRYADTSLMRKTNEYQRNDK